MDLIHRYLLLFSEPNPQMPVRSAVMFAAADRTTKEVRAQNWAHESTPAVYDISDQPSERLAADQAKNA